MTRVAKNPAYLPSGEASYSADEDNRGGETPVASANTLLMDDFSGTGALTGQSPNINQGANWNNWNALGSASEGSGVLACTITGYQWNGSDIGQTECSIWAQDVAIQGQTASSLLRMGLQSDNYASYQDGLWVQVEGAAGGSKLIVYEMLATVATVKQTSTVFGSTPPVTQDFFATIKNDGTGKMVVTGYDSSRSSVVTWTQTAVNNASVVDQGMVTLRNTSASTSLGAVAWFDDGDISNMPTSFPT